MKVYSDHTIKRCIQLGIMEDISEASYDRLDEILTEEGEFSCREGWWESPECISGELLTGANSEKIYLLHKDSVFRFQHYLRLRGRI